MAAPVVEPLGVNPYPEPQLRTDASVRAGSAWDEWSARLAPVEGINASLPAAIGYADANRDSFRIGLENLQTQAPGLALGDIRDNATVTLGQESPGAALARTVPVAPASLPVSNWNLSTAWRLIDEWHVWLNNWIQAAVSPWYK